MASILRPASPPPYARRTRGHSPFDGLAPGRSEHGDPVSNAALVAVEPRTRRAAGPWAEQVDTSRTVLSIALEEVGGQTELRLGPSRSGPAAAGARPGTVPVQHVSLLPAGTAVWEYCAGIRRFRGIRFHFDFARAWHRWGPDSGIVQELPPNWREGTTEAYGLPPTAGPATGGRYTSAAALLPAALVVPPASPVERSHVPGASPARRPMAAEILAPIPRLMFCDDRIWRCADLISRECEIRDGPDGRFTDSLIAAMMVALFEHLARRGEPPATAGLAPWQLRRVLEHLEQHAFQVIRLADLATLAGLSVSYFTRAFKASTGLPPHRWQTRLRITHAQRMLMEGDRPLTDVALAVGFADQSHFTRVFRAQVGVTPGQWRREQASCPSTRPDRADGTHPTEAAHDRASAIRVCRV
ncbi:MAG: helix-turn-helix transcriptional regulator [Rhodospirillales bacterium]|nr:helix-turn-helix transcriptional regulator [Rhodospirillales bacterium]